MLNFPQDSSPNNLEIRSFADHLDQQLNLVAADASSYYPFPPTIFCPDGLHDLLVFPTSSSPDIIINNTSTAAATTTPPAQPDLLPHSDRGAAMAAASTQTSFPRARVSRKDRHSKIFTASGPRDRRMRLSIDVARNFFQLQDMLGFDKASKTVQWLLSMSKAAIKDLAAASSSSAKHCCTCSSHLSPNSTESSTISGSKNKQHSTSTVTASRAVVQVRKLTTTTTTKRKKGSTNYNKPSTNKADNYLHSTLVRESRAKARERARERTKEKQRLTSLTSSNSVPFDHDVKQESTAFGDLKSVLELGDDRANCGYPSDLFPVYGNTSNQQGAVGDQAGGGIYQEQWDLEAISFYSRIGMSIIFETNGLDSLLQETKERKPH